MFFALSLLYVTLALLTALRASGAAAPSIVTVIAGKPTEYRFIVNPSTGIALGPVTFKVTNNGAVSHRLQVCTGSSSTCAGPATALLAKGKSASLTVTFTRAATYRLVSTPADVARGMKASVVVKAAPTPTPTTTTTTTASAVVSKPTTVSSSASVSPSASTGSSSSTVAAGKVVWTNVGCGGCHSITSLKGSVNSSLNSTHPEPFPGGSLTQQQIVDVAAYIDAS